MTVYRLKTKLYIGIETCAVGDVNVIYKDVWIHFCFSSLLGYLISKKKEKKSCKKKTTYVLMNVVA